MSFYSVGNYMINIDQISYTEINKRKDDDGGKEYTEMTMTMVCGQRLNFYDEEIEEIISFLSKCN